MGLELAVKKKKEKHKTFTALGTIKNVLLFLIGK